MRWILASAVAAAVLGLGFANPQDTCACGGTDWHAGEYCEAYPVQPSDYTHLCWNPAHGWHGHIRF